ncbi:putative Mammalian cell entry related domain protein [Methylacidimicrobium sp. AP8]|uniref:MlaD family protein n=1 Tax=Methylacidimicrobium sp. AP8 TaxID=2730359 RepID=UPI0018C14855|nr:MlaD family protein [Methylacidimicrobium sp. AP8]CAB4242823.1 putative Mammalian cell entry related domain protein [Methylacidimicrobium sp. AP8]
MNRKIKDVKIGLFVLAALALLVAGLLAFGLRDLFVPHDYFETYVSGGVAGLSVGSPVLLDGVPIGKVTQITFSWLAYPPHRRHFVVVVGEVSTGIAQGETRQEREQQLQEAIDHGLRARIQSQGITGTSVVALEYVNPKRFPPLSVPWKPRHYYIPSAPGQFKDIVQEVETLLEKLSAVDFPALGASANGLLGELRRTNGQLKTLLDQTTTTLASGNLPELLETTDRTLAQIRDASASLNEMIGDIRRYPAGFFFGQPPPRPESLQGSKR